MVAWNKGVFEWLCFIVVIVINLAVHNNGTSVNVAKSGVQVIPGLSRVVVCYVASWATYRPAPGKFTLDNIDPTLCSHLVYAFAGLNITSNSIRSLDPYNDLEEDYGKGSYKKMAAMRNRHPHLKVTLAIGGWNEGSANYSLLASTPDRRRTFVNSVTNFIRKYNFDGLDLDWEFPGMRGGRPEDKVNFVALVKDLREAFDKHGWLLTAALGAGVNTIDTAYDVKSLGQHLDFLHAMCYDYHGAWDKRTGSNTPFRSQPDKFSVEDSIDHFIRLGAPRHKLVLGLSMYGRTFNTEVEGSTELGVPAEEKGFQGPLTREDGFLGYNEICTELGNNESQWLQYWDEATDTPYAVQGRKVITFDNPQSIALKTKYAVASGLAGVMVWAMDNDDFLGDCDARGGNYPLLRAIGHAMIKAEMEIREKPASAGVAALTLSTVLTVAAIGIAIVAGR